MGITPVVMFDLDSTVIDTSHRHLRILREFCFDQPDCHVARVADNISPREIGWSLEAALRARGVHDEQALGALHTYWKHRFFTNDYCRADIPYSGAPGFVRRCWAAGAVICYLSARPVETMGEGTLHTLQRWQMPVLTGRVVLHLKPDARQPDHAFKHQALDDLAALGTLLATFENEPANCNSLAQRFPDAHHWLVETCHSPDAPPLDPAVLRTPNLAS